MQLANVTKANPQLIRTPAGNFVPVESRLGKVTLANVTRTQQLSGTKLLDTPFGPVGLATRIKPATIGLAIFGVAATLIGLSMLAQPVARKVAPVVATAAGGPLAGAAASAVS